MYSWARIDFASLKAYRSDTIYNENPLSLYPQVSSHRESYDDHRDDSEEQCQKQRHLIGVCRVAERCADSQDRQEDVTNEEKRSDKDDHTEPSELGERSETQMIKEK